MSETVKFRGPFWRKEIIEEWQKAFETTGSSVRLDMSDINFVNLFDWITIVSMIEKVLANSSVRSFEIDIKGSSPSNHIPLSEYIKIKKGEATKRHFSQSDITFSERAYSLLGFIESLGTLDILNRGDKDGKVYYPGILIDDVRSHRFYSREEGEPTALLDLTRIKTKEDCKQFVDEKRILNWRQAMGSRFQESPIFESEEVWRVLCHEFAVNIWEHSGVSGFISMRVVSPIDSNTGRIHKWCQWSYPDYINRLFISMRSGFLELCIGDAGKGFIETLVDAYVKIADIKDRSKIKPEDILAFAFDELGTCKNRKDSWATERHALNRILLIIAKYGGVLTIHSGGVELLYRGEGEIFQKKPNGWGYKPNELNRMEGIIPGTQFQIILPLIPYIKKKKDQIPVLVKSLPTTFHIEDGQVRGHLVPLLEKLDQPVACTGKEEQHNFREACENLSQELLKKRPKMDPLVLDFSQLNWTAGQFETLLHYLQNILQHRPALLVEIDPKLVKEVIQLEELPAPTMLDKHLIYQKSTKPDQFYGELSESKFLETYSGIHATVLGIDRNEYRYIFGLRSPTYKAPLLSLVETEKSIKELCEETIWGEPLKQSTLQAILNCINPLFQENKGGKWRTVWDVKQLSTEVRRVMSYHFDNVAERSNAWRGYPYEKEKCKFNLPWQEEWRSNFLESSGILSRERHSDEIAQRLIYRLQKGLEIIGKSLQDVKVLVCVTAPSMLLASFLHRWWPLQLERPAVSDLGYYVMLSHPKDLPTIIKAGGIVIVQHILDTGKVSGDLVDVLKRQSLDILCIISFIKMDQNLSKTTVTPIEKGWAPNEDEEKELFIPKHAMIEVKRPPVCDPPKTYEEELNSFWIEPRSLRPVRYTTLRRQFEPGRDPDIDRRNRYLKRFDNSPGGCLFAAGHYVYGRRHFPVTVDIRRTLTGEIGAEIALWIADICENIKGRKKSEWESGEGYSLEGDITAVLMPLHSQIHYIWPQVENILAQRGRRQPAWFLDATLFSGRGPAYYIPHQFQYQIQRAVRGIARSTESKQKESKNPLRILILDDGIATARTAETILVKILRTINKEFLRIDRKMQDYPHPIQWIRYFCVLNQMGHARHILWRNLKSIGKESIKFVFEEYAPFMGTPFYNEDECPICRDCERIKHLKSISEQYGIESARNWAEMRLEKLQPIAIDSPGFNISNKCETLKQGIHVLKIEKKDNEVSDFYTTHASTAIWRFYELMYLSYPSGDILNSLKYAWVIEQESPDEREEYERYRWAVYEWCLRNWKRLEANTAIEIFISQAKKEIKHNTPLIQPILDGCSQHFESPQIIQFIAECINMLAELEAQRVASDRGADPTRIKSTINMNTALAIFWLNIPANQWESICFKISPKSEEVRLIDHLDKAAIALDSRGHSFLRNLYRQLKRPQRHIDPKWALDTIAESLFRGRGPLISKHGRHHLLPKLISNVLKGGADDEDRLLLHGSLTLFLAALDDILHFDYQLSIDIPEIKKLSLQVLKGLKDPTESKRGKKNIRSTPRTVRCIFS